MTHAEIQQAIAEMLDPSAFRALTSTANYLSESYRQQQRQKHAVILAKNIIQAVQSMLESQSGPSTRSRQKGTVH